MSRTVTLVLTVPQAVALARAAENTTLHPDAMEAIFPDARSRAAAGSAVEKLNALVPWSDL